MVSGVDDSSIWGSGICCAFIGDTSGVSSNGVRDGGVLSMKSKLDKLESGLVSLSDGILLFTSGVDVVGDVVGESAEFFFMKRPSISLFCS